MVTTRFSSLRMPRNPWSKAKNSFFPRLATLCDSLSHIDVRSTLLKCAILAHELFNTAVLCSLIAGAQWRYHPTIDRKSVV